MTVESTLYTTLTNDADVSALVGTRVRANVADENTATPYIVFLIVSERTPVTFNDISQISETRIQIDCWATSPTQARTLADHVVDAVNTNMKLVEVFKPGTQYDHDVKLHRFILDLTVWA